MIDCKGTTTVTSAWVDPNQMGHDCGAINTRDVFSVISSILTCHNTFAHLQQRIHFELKLTS